MSKALVVSGGLPGKMTATSLQVPTSLSKAKTIEALELVGRLERGSPWWGADLLIYAEDRWGEEIAQIAEALNWAPATVVNVIRVGRAVPPSRRRAGLTFSHHAEVAALEPDEQRHWLAKAEKGENGEPWSSRRLRSEMKGLPSGSASEEREPCPACKGTGYKA